MNGGEITNVITVDSAGDISLSLSHISRMMGGDVHCPGKEIGGRTLNEQVTKKT